MSISFSDEVNEEIITTTASLPEDGNEGSLRPRTIREYIGQEKAKEKGAVICPAEQVRLSAQGRHRHQAVKRFRMEESDAGHDRHFRRRNRSIVGYSSSYWS